MPAGWSRMPQRRQRGKQRSPLCVADGSLAKRVTVEVQRVLVGDDEPATKGRQWVMHIPGRNGLAGRFRHVLTRCLPDRRRSAGDPPASGPGEAC